MYTKQEYKMYDDAHKEIVKSKNMPIYTTMLFGDEYSLETNNYNIETIAHNDILILNVKYYTVTITNKQTKQSVSFVGSYAAKMYQELFTKNSRFKRQR